MTTIRETSTGETVGDSRFHEEFGAPSDRAVLKLKSHLTPYVREFIQNAPFAIMATADADGRGGAHISFGGALIIETFSTAPPMPACGRGGPPPPRNS